MVQLGDVAFIAGGFDYRGMPLEDVHELNLTSLAMSLYATNLSDARAPYCAAVDGKAVFVGAQSTIFF